MQYVNTTPDIRMLSYMKIQTYAINVSKNGGESGIRTRGPDFSGHQFSKLAH